jgi:hypothetical protein
MDGRRVNQEFGSFFSRFIRGPLAVFCRTRLFAGSTQFDHDPRRVTLSRAEMISTIDKKALKILFSTYWGASGWKKEPYVSPADLAYAKWFGLMFDRVYLSHDQGVDWALQSRALVSKKWVADQFLASLTSRRLDLRSALGSFAVGLNLSAHTWDRANSSTRFCPVCQMYERLDKPEDLNVLNFERFKWGGVRHTNPIYIGFDLAEARKNTRVNPTEKDRQIIENILQTILSLPVDARPSDLEKKLASVFQSNTQERRTLIGILGYCGILIDPGRPSFLETFPHSSARQDAPSWKNDWPYPIRWWRGAFGVNEKAVGFWFPGLSKAKS